MIYMKCPRCGKTLPPGDEVCPYCGYEVNVENLVKQAFPEGTSGDDESSMSNHTAGILIALIIVAMIILYLIIR